MKIVLAPDSFKGSLSASQVCDAMEVGIRRVWPSAEITSVPLADGGEGTLDALLRATQGTKRTEHVHGPLDKDINAEWGVLPDGTAVIELAQAAGLHLIEPTPKNALVASTRGVGQLIIAALNFGCRHFIIGLGGSATTDGGTGALTALGLRLFDQEDVILASGGGALINLKRIEAKFLDPRLEKCNFTILCDVTNSLYGKNGAAHIFGSQKGASKSEITVLDQGLKRWAEVVREGKFAPQQLETQAGTGAAGGVGFGLMAFCNAKMQSGIETILETVGFNEILKNADLILTGEGALDEQTLGGKTISGVCERAKTYSLPIIAFGGKVSLSGKEMDELGLKSAFSITKEPSTLQWCLNNASSLLQDSVERALRLRAT